MRTISVSEAKARLSHVLELVQRGESVVILSRGEPVARIQPVDREAVPSPLRYAHLVRRGILRAPLERLDPSKLASPSSPPRRGSTLRDAVIDERREGR